MKLLKTPRKILTMLLCVVTFGSLFPNYTWASESELDEIAVSTETTELPDTLEEDGMTDEVTTSDKKASDEEETMNPINPVEKTTIDADNNEEETMNPINPAEETTIDADNSEEEDKVAEQTISEEAAEAVPLMIDDNGIDTVEIGSVPSAGLLKGTTTTEQPLNPGTAGSQYFRIPAMITLQNGSLIAAADARYGTTGDGGGLDTIVSISEDNGKTWTNSFPIYFPDSNGYASQQATTIIDPVLVQGEDGTIYLMADVNPTGVTTMGGYTYPKTGTGYITVDGVKRLALTDNYDNVNTAPSDADTNTYRYYVGDLEAGYASVIDRETGEKTKYVVDDCFNIYLKSGDKLVAPVQKQVDTEKDVQQNVFYKGSILHVYNTGYMWLAVSKDNGVTWSHTILNPQIKRDNETALLVSPGRGTVTSDGTILIPFYTWDTNRWGATNAQQSTFIFSKDNGKTWTRTPDVPHNKRDSSECEIVELKDHTLRLFARNTGGTVAYADAVWDETSKNYKWKSGIISTGVRSTSTCNISAIKYSKQIDGKDAILVACPGNGSSRTDGRIFVFLVDKDNSMKLGYTYEVNDSIFCYSCLTELDNGRIGLLWEVTGSSIRYDDYDITDLAAGSAVNGERLLTVPLYGRLTDLVDGRFSPEGTIDESIVKMICEEKNVSGVMTNLGNDRTFSGGKVKLESAEYTFNLNDDGTYTVTGKTADGITVYLRTADKQGGKPQSANASEAGKIKLTGNDDGTFDIQSMGSYSRYLYFWRDGKNCFDQNSRPAEETKMMLYRSAVEGETSSQEVPGYVQVKSTDQITNGGRYLIVASYGGSYYALYPSTSSEKYNHCSRVGEFENTTTTTVTYEGVKDGEVRFKDAVSGYTYVIRVVPKQITHIGVKTGDTFFLELDGNDVTVEADASIADAYVRTNSENRTYVGGQGKLSTGENSAIANALYHVKALHDENGNMDGYTVSAKTVDDKIVYLALRNGMSGYPQTGKTTASVRFNERTGEPGEFEIYTGAGDDGRYLHFYRNGKNVFDQVNKIEGYVNETKMRLYRPVTGNETSSTEVPGYVRVMSAAEIAADGYYLIAAECQGKIYLLNPSDSESDKNAHVMTVDPGAQQIETTLTDTYYKLEVTGKQPGVTDIVVNGRVYRITVSGTAYQVKQEANGSVTEQPGSGSSNNAQNNVTQPAKPTTESSQSPILPPASKPDSVQPTPPADNLKRPQRNIPKAQGDKNKKGGETRPFIQGEDGKEGWDVIRAESEVCAEGGTITVNMNGSSIVPGDIFDMIRGRDITIEFELDNGIIWQVNGKSVQKENISDIDFHVALGEEASDTIPADQINALSGKRFSMNMTLAHDGAFGFEAIMRLKIGEKNKGLIANLFYYNVSTDALEFICADKIDATGLAEFNFTHASDYTIILDTASMESVEQAEKKLAEDTTSDNNEQTTTTEDITASDSDAFVLFIWIIVLSCLAVLIVTGFLVLKKRQEK